MPRRPTPWSRDVVERLRLAFEPAADATRAAPMARYMKDRFAFLGIASPERAALVREVLATSDRPDQRDVLAAASSLWALDEREYQYAACTLLSRHARLLDAAAIDDLRHLVTHKSWWDTVDDLATHAVAPVVLANRPTLAPVMDTWIDDADIWVARTAILHQNPYKTATDPVRLFDYCLRRSDDTEFFIRKAIGWALREYSKTDAEAVRRFVADHEDRLSGLSRREALKWLERRRRMAR